MRTPRGVTCVGRVEFNYNQIEFVYFEFKSNSKKFEPSNWIQVKHEKARLLSDAFFSI